MKCPKCSNKLLFLKTAMASITSNYFQYIDFYCENCQKIYTKFLKREECLDYHEEVKKE